LRSAADRDALVAGVQTGTIDCICSDHQPHDIDAKLGAFPETEPGMATLETVLPLMLRMVAQGDLDLSQGIMRLSAAPAKVLAINAGQLAVGSYADICLFDPKQSWQVNSSTWQSQGCNTPFWQDDMVGKVTHTIQAGKLIFKA
jgi:dihydroorotase